MLIILGILGYSKEQKNAQAYNNFKKFFPGETSQSSVTLSQNTVSLDETISAKVGIQEIEGFQTERQESYMPDVVFPKKFNDPFVYGQGKYKVVFSQENANKSPGKVIDNKIVYANVYKDVDALYYLGPGLKESYIFKSDRSPNEIRWRVVMDNLSTMELEKEEIIFKDTEGKKIISIPAPVIVTLDGEVIKEKIKYEVDGDALILKINKEELSYPFLVDPTFTGNMWEQEEEISYSEFNAISSTGTQLIKGGTYSATAVIPPLSVSGTNNSQKVATLDNRNIIVARAEAIDRNISGQCRLSGGAEVYDIRVRTGVFTNSGQQFDEQFILNVPCEEFEARADSPWKYVPTYFKKNLNGSLTVVWRRFSASEQRMIYVKRNLLPYLWQSPLSAFYLNEPISSCDGNNPYINLTWTASQGAANYNIQRKRGTGNYTTIGNVLNTEYRDSNVSSGYSYTYRVIAYSSDGMSERISNNDRTITAARCNGNAQLVLDSVATSCDGATARATLTWTSTLSGVKYFKVYRNNKQIATNIPSGTTTYTDSGLTKNTSYTYYIFAEGPDRRSNDYAIVAPTCLGNFSLTATSACQGTNERVRLTWGASANASSYDVLRDGAIIETLTGTNFDDPNVEKDQSYTYKVIAKGPGGTPTKDNENGDQTLTVNSCGTDTTKKVRVEVEWEENGMPRKVETETFLGN